MRYLIIALELLSLAFSTGCAVTAARDYRSEAAWSLALGAQSDVSPSPVAKKYKRSECPVCKGTGRIKTGDGISTTECEACELAATVPPSCQCTACKCQPTIISIPVTPKAPVIVAPTTKPQAVLPKKPATVSRPVVSTAPKKTYTYSGSCANGSRGSSRGIFRRGR